MAVIVSSEMTVIGCCMEVAMSIAVCDAMSDAMSDTVVGSKDAVVGSKDTMACSKVTVAGKGNIMSNSSLRVVMVVYSW